MPLVSGFAPRLAFSTSQRWQDNTAQLTSTFDQSSVWLITWY